MGFQRISEQRGWGGVLLLRPDSLNPHFWTRGNLDPLPLLDMTLSCPVSKESIALPYSWVLKRPSLPWQEWASSFWHVGLRKLGARWPLGEQAAKSSGSPVKGAQPLPAHQELPCFSLPTAPGCSALNHRLLPITKGLLTLFRSPLIDSTGEGNYKP